VIELQVFEAGTGDEIEADNPARQCVQVDVPPVLAVIYSLQFAIAVDFTQLAEVAEAVPVLVTVTEYPITQFVHCCIELAPWNVLY